MLISMYGQISYNIQEVYLFKVDLGGTRFKGGWDQTWFDKLIGVFGN